MPMFVLRNAVETPNSLPNGLHSLGEVIPDNEGAHLFPNRPRIPRQRHYKRRKRIRLAAASAFAGALEVLSLLKSHHCRAPCR